MKTNTPQLLRGINLGGKLTMKFFKPIIMCIMSCIIVCTVLILLGAPFEPVMLGGLSVIVLSMGKSVYDHFRHNNFQDLGSFL